MNTKKKEIRENLRLAINLERIKLITQDQLRWLAMNALAQEITIDLEEKIERKTRKMLRKSL